MDFNEFTGSSKSWRTTNSDVTSDIEAIKAALRGVPVRPPTYVVRGLADAVKTDMEKRGISDINEWMRVVYDGLDDEQKAELLYQVWQAGAF